MDFLADPQKSIETRLDCTCTRGTDVKENCQKSNFYKNKTWSII